MQTVLKVEGMSCEHCERHVKDDLQELAGVQSASASHKEKQVIVEHDDSVGLAAIKAIIEESGYQVV